MSRRDSRPSSVKHQVPPFRLRLKFNPPIDELIKMMPEIERDLHDWRSVWPEIKGVVHDAWRNAFAGRAQVVGKSAGKPWPPLSPGYLRSKLRAGFPADILVRTGALRANTTGSAALVRSDAKALVFDATVDHARHVWFGFHGRDYPVKPRHFLGVPKPEADRIRDIMRDRVQRVVDAAIARRTAKAAPRGQ